jgi:hypothetical protein
MYGKTWSGFVCLFVWALLFIVLGCSEISTPLGPEDDSVELGLPSPGDRTTSEFVNHLAASDHWNYESISATISGESGGTVSGSVTGYRNAFSITAPEQSFLGSRDLTIMVPKSGVPIYHLLPHGEFDKAVTVTLDYYLWITNGEIAHGDNYEVLFMNEESLAYETLSPRVLFVADSTASTVKFMTTHFSRWEIWGED